MTHSKHTVFLFLAVACLSLAGCSKDSDFEKISSEESAEKQFPSQWRTDGNQGFSRYADKVFEYTPAPGQFINDTSVGETTYPILTPEEAAQWAQERFNDKLFVSLGAFGGYVVVGFDHEVINSVDDYDFAIFGNAYFNSSGEGGSNEPGIVYVMTDSNENGLPDDTWYELRGSAYYDPTTIHDYAVTYFRPSKPAQPVEWTDNLGNSGTIDYLKAFHKQDYYYPAWISEDSYTLSGTRLKDRTQQDSETGVWNNCAFEWGYADNMGEDSTSIDGMPQVNRFRISDAVDAEGNTVDLRSISFVKVQTGVLSQAGHLGEVSTEVLGFYDLMTEPQEDSVPMIHN